MEKAYWLAGAEGNGENEAQPKDSPVGRDLHMRSL
jgi:hypothetical protein